MEHTTPATNSDPAIEHRHDGHEGHHTHAHAHGHHHHGRPEGDEGLDEMHEAVKFYLGGALSLAPLEGSSPRSILEMGSGTGTWAIQAAKQFPEADVLAIDLTPLPSKPMPSNLRFQTVDMTKPFSFGPQTFDIVHSRFVFHHLANFEEALNRTMQLIKPGGFLLLDEVEFRVEGGVVPGFWKQFQDLMMGKDSFPRAGSKLQGILESSGLFSPVHVRKIVLPISKCDEPQTDVGVRGMAQCFRTMLNRILVNLKGNVEVNNFDPEAIDAAIEEINDPGHDMDIDIWMTWSRRVD